VRYPISASEVFIQLGQPPNRIDIITSCKGLVFDNCWTEKVSIEVEEITLHFLDLENLRLNKKTVERPQDLGDLDNLRAK